MNIYTILPYHSLEHLTTRMRFPMFLKKMPDPHSYLRPMLATLTKHYFSRKNWIFEPKFDGVRCLAYKKNGKVSLVSRNNKEMNREYPEIVHALEQQKADNFIIDGEVVALQHGISKFELLQGRINLRSSEKITEKLKKIPIKYVIFDLLYTDGYDVHSKPLLQRKKLLKSLLQYNTLLVWVDHGEEQGEKFFKEACNLGWEGIIAKKADSVYESRRSRNWLKFKCAQAQELVIGGYTDSQRSRTDFGALLVGYYRGKKLIYAGKVGTGFTRGTLSMLGKKLRALETNTCPFSIYTEPTQGVHWVRPRLVADFEFAEWTKAGRLRVPRYKGLRTDKPARDVIKEIPQ